MHKEGDEIHIDDVEASGGSKEGVVRYVLAGGLILAIIMMSVVWIVPAMTQGDVEEEATVSGEISSMEEEGDSTDSILGTDEEQVGDDNVTQEDGIEVIEN